MKSKLITIISILLLSIVIILIFKVKMAKDSNGESLIFLNKKIMGDEIKVQNETPIRTSFISVGDIMPSRLVNKKIRENGEDYIFKHISEYLRSVDFVFGNLESPSNGTKNVNHGETLQFNTPPSTIKNLYRNNIKVLNIANNHIYDQGDTGLQYTTKLLEDGDFVYFGAGQNSEQAWEPKIINSNNIKIAFIGASYTTYNDHGQFKNEKVARMEDIQLLKTSIEKAKSNADFVIVAMHAGIEYTSSPNQIQVDFAKKAIDYGADMIFGSHPHWIQDIEKYREKYIFYSLGNFIFDQDWSEKTKQGLTVKVDLVKYGKNANIEKIELVPVYIENYGQVRQANEKEKELFLDRITLSDLK